MLAVSDLKLLLKVLVFFSACHWFWTHCNFNSQKNTKTKMADLWSVILNGFWPSWPLKLWKLVFEHFAWFRLHLRWRLRKSQIFCLLWGACVTRNTFLLRAQLLPSSKMQNMYLVEPPTRTHMINQSIKCVYLTVFFLGNRDLHQQHFDGRHLPAIPKKGDKDICVTWFWRTYTFRLVVDPKTICNDRLTYK